MTLYLVDRKLPGITQEELTLAQQAAVETSKQFTAEGRLVRYIRSSWIPSESHVMCLFEAENPNTVREVNKVAGIPFTGIFEAVDLPLSTKKKSIKRSFYILAGGIGAGWIICMIVLASHLFGS